MFQRIKSNSKRNWPHFCYSSVTIQGSKHFALYINCQIIFRPKPRLITPLLSAIQFQQESFASLQLFCNIVSKTSFSKRYSDPLISKQVGMLKAQNHRVCLDLLRQFCGREMTTHSEIPSSFLTLPYQLKDRASECHFSTAKTYISTLLYQKHILTHLFQSKLVC